MPTIDLDELPAHPTGWKRRMISHIRAAQPIGSSALFEILDHEGRVVVGILFGYRTGTDCKGSGFALSGEEGNGFLPWAEFRVRYAKHRASRRKAVARG